MPENEVGSQFEPFPGYSRNRGVSDAPTPTASASGCPRPGADHTLRVLARIAVAVYASLLLAAPAAHDAADHVKSSPHCQLCTARPQAARAEPRVVLAPPTLPAAGEVAGPRHRGFVAPVPFRTSGRSPPA